MTYILFKRETCFMCKGSGVDPKWWSPETEKAITQKASVIPLSITAEFPITCSACGGSRYTDEAVDLLDVLKKISWGKTISEDWRGILAERNTFENLTIEE